MLQIKANKLNNLLSKLRGVIFNILSWTDWPKKWKKMEEAFWTKKTRKGMKEKNGTQNERDKGGKDASQWNRERQENDRHKEWQNIDPRNKKAW